MKDIIKNNHGTVFPPAMVFAGYILLAFGIIVVITHWILGVILLFVSVFISFSFYGIDVDTDTKKYKEYSIYFGIKCGKWFSLDKFLFLTVLCNNEVYEIHSRANITTSESVRFYDVYLLDKQHREKLLLKKFKNADSAEDYAKKISGILDLELTNYDPVLTEKTRARRYKR